MFWNREKHDQEQPTRADLQCRARGGFHATGFSYSRLRLNVGEIILLTHPWHEHERLKIIKFELENSLFRIMISLQRKINKKIVTKGLI